MMTNLPNALTLGRIAVIPPFVAVFYVGGPLSNWLAFGIFAAASMTDWFDGYFARKLDQQSAFGRFLDPLADKLLVAAALIMTVAFGQIAGLAVLPAMAILCRELMISGLREFLAGAGVSVPVSRLAKWKTTVQMTAIGVLLVGEAGPASVPVVAIGDVLLWIAAVLSLWTGYDYLRGGLGHILGQDALRSGRMENGKRGDTGGGEAE